MKTKFRFNRDFIYQIINGQMTIFDYRQSNLYTFNNTATLIFGKLKLGWTMEKTADYLARYYHLPLNQAQVDVTDLVRDLQKRKIIVKPTSGSKKTSSRTQTGRGDSKKR